MVDARSPQLALQQAGETTAAAPTLSTKSVKKGLFMSAALPGAGQLYNGNYIKAAAFIAAEAAGWTLYITQNKKGNDIDAEFRAFADEHWSENDYWDWIARHSGIDRNDIEALREWEGENFSHGLHREKDQQYYEMIGKYDQFNYAWDDSDIGLLDEGFDKSKRSANRLYYEERRAASNAAFKRATTGATIVLFNHIVSALDAAWSINRGNQQFTANVYGDYKLVNSEPVPSLNLSLNW